MVGLGFPRTTVDSRDTETDVRRYDCLDTGSDTPTSVSGRSDSVLSSQPDCNGGKIGEKIVSNVLYLVIQPEVLT